MPCLLAIVALAFPRLVLALIFIVSHYLQRAIPDLVFLLLGFLLLPLTTLAYAWTMNSHGRVEGLYLVAIVIAVLADLGLLSGGYRGRRRID